MHYSDELWRQTREEVSRLRSELKAFNKSRASLTDAAEKEAAKQKAREMQRRYDEVIRQYNELKAYRQWAQSAGRELLYIND